MLVLVLEVALGWWCWGALEVSGSLRCALDRCKCGCGKSDGHTKVSLLGPGDARLADSSKVL